MQEKNKDYPLSKKTRAIFLCSLILFGLFSVSQKVEAFLGTGLFDFFSAALEGVEEEVAPVTQAFIILLFTYAYNLVLLFVSSNLLQFVLNNRQWLTIQNSALVQAGWHFTAGLVNLLLILIFVIIAIAYILRIESLQAKKSLARLIVVALLMNFSLVFIGILIDISNVFYNTIMEAGGPNFITSITDQLIGGGLMVVIGAAAAMIVLVVLWLIPFVGPFSQLGFGIFMLTANLPTVVMWIFQIFIFSTLSGILLTYTFIFAARVFVIQLLASIAPLAFICLILPQTKKFWSEWLHHLVSWITAGIIILLFLVIGSKVTLELSPPNILTFAPVIGFFYIIPALLYYFFIFVYLVLLLFVSSKTMPPLASFLIAQAQSMGKMGWGMIGKPLVQNLGAGAGRAWREKMPERARKWGDRQLTRPIWGADVKGVKGAMMRGLGAVPYGIRRGVGGAVSGAAINEAGKGKLTKAEAEAKGKDVVENLGAMRQRLAVGDTAGATGKLTAMINQNQIKDALDKDVVGAGNELSDQEVLKSYKKARDLRDKDSIENIQFSFARLEEQFSEIIDRETAGYAVEKRTREGLTEKERAPEEQGGKGYSSYADKIMDSAKNADDIKKLQKDWWDNDKLMAAAQRFWTGSQLSKAAETFGREFVDEYSEVIDELPLEQQIALNPKAAMYRSGNAAQDLGFSAPAGLGREQVQQLVREFNEERRRMRQIEREVGEDATREAEMRRRMQEYDEFYREQ